jgi:hypothetical protein
MSKRDTDQEVRQAFRRFADALVKAVYAFRPRYPRTLV